MKKVVLLAGAVAAGMAIAPQAANAAAPKAPISPIVNEVDAININTGYGLNTAGITLLLADWQVLLNEVTDFMSDPIYAYADASVKATYERVVNHIEWNMLECRKVIDTPYNNATPGVNAWDDNCSLFFENGDGYDDLLGLCRDTSAAGIEQIAPYWPAGGPIVFQTTIYDVFWGLKTAVQDANAKVKKSSIKNQNKATCDALKASADYKHLVDVLQEAKDINDGVDLLYKDPLTYKELKDQEFDAHLKDGAMVSAKNLIDKINDIANVEDVVISKFELETDLGIVLPELEGLVVTFKKHANEEAAKKIQTYVTTEVDKIDGIIAGLQHHLDTKATCFDQANHKIAENSTVKDKKAQVTTDLGTLEPDASWNILPHHATDPTVDRALSDPEAVKVWYAIQNGNTNVIDTDLTKFESEVYKTCLKYDLLDIKAALDELDGANYRAALEDGKTAKDETPVESDIKTWLHDHLTKTTQDGTAAKEWKELNDYFNTTYLTTTVDINDATFNIEEAKVDELEKTLANIKANWADIVSLNNDLRDLKVSMADAKDKDGYLSTTIKDKWENATSGEKKHYNDLLTSVENAIDNINDKAATAASNGKAGEWVGKDSFATTITLEKDHHDWLDTYQKANWDAYQTMLTKINERRAEADNVKASSLSSTTNSTLEGMSKQTVTKNNGVTFYNIQGENLLTGNNNGIFIYRVKYFNEIEKHFAFTGTPGGSDEQGHGDDLRNDRITSWYNSADAEYLGSKDYTTGWASAQKQGELKNNTGKGVADVLTTEATEADNVVFGWLQKEIQKAYQEIVINEAANRKLHDQIDDCATYVQNAKNDIDNYAKFTLTHPKQEVKVYNMSAGTYADEVLGNTTWNLDILYNGTTSGVDALTPVALPDEYKTKEDATVITLSPVSPNYNSNFACGHDTAVKGWTWIGIEINDLRNLEREKYNAVESKDLLDSKAVENRITIVEENVDDIKNEAYTQIIKNGFARVHNSINEARALAANLDGVCHEDGLKPCSTEDIKNNPCGWDDPAASKALADLVNYYNEKLALLGTEHSAENNDDHATPVVAEDNIKEFAGYLDQMYKDLNAWAVKFVAADTKHKLALNAALVLAGEEAHALHHYSYDANQALINYNDAEKAAVNLWAVDFSKRKIGTFDGEEVTFQAFVKKIDEKMIAEGAVDHTLDPDVYAAIKKFAAEPIAKFQDYIDATEKLEGFIKVVAQVYYNHHQYTELKKLADGTKNFNWDADFQKAVDANNAAHVELLKQLAQAQATLDAAKNDVIADKNEVYPVDYTTLTTTDLNDAQNVLNTQEGKIEEAWKAGKAADHIEVVEDVRTEVKGYALDITKDGKNVIDAYVEKAQAAKNLYAANKLAKEELLRQVEAALTTLKADYEKADFTGGDQCMSEYKTKYETLKAEIEALKTSVNNSFDKKFADITGESKTVETLQGDIDTSIKKLGQIEKTIADYNTKVLASDNAAKNLNNMIDAAFATKVVDGNLIPVGEKMKEAMVEGYLNFQTRPAAPAISNTEVKYFNQILDDIDALKAQIATDNGHVTTVDGVEVGGHVVAEKYADYLQAMANIQADLEELVQAIKDNEQAHKDQLKHRDELYKKYECYDTTGLEAAVKFIKDPDFSLDSEFPEVPGYPETAVDPAGKDHTKAHTAVAEAIKALDAEIKKHYENGASNVEAAKTKIGEKETAYTTAFEHAQANDSKFMEEYGKCTEAAKAVGNPAPLNWEADHFENGANKYSDEANVQVTNAYEEMVAAQKAYLADIKTDWYKNEAVEKVADNEGLLNTYKEKITAYKAAVEKAQTNDQEFDKQYAAHVVKPLTAEATYTDTRVTDDPTYVTLKGQLTALYPECNNVETDSKYNTIRKQIIQDWEDEKSALNGTAAAVAAYQAAAQKYNELMANLNAYGSQLVKYFQQSDAFDEAKTTIAGYDIMTSDLKDFDGNTEGAKDYDHKKDIVKAINDIDDKLNTLYSDMKTEAEHVAETINDTDLTNNEVNDLYVDPAVGTIKTLIENLAKDAKKYEDACDANEAAFEPLHDNIKTVEADYAEGSAKVTALPEPAQEAFNLAVKEDLQALAGLQEDLEEAYMAENAAAFTKDNTDYEDLKAEIEAMYARAVLAGANLGDIDGVDGITVYDSDALVDIVLYNRGYAVKGDFDFNGENDVTDVERLNNLLWYKHIEKAWAPGRVAFEGDIELTAEGNTVALALNNNVQTNGIQFDVTVPEGAYIQNVLGTDRVEGMRVLTACIADNTYRVLVISTLNASTINGNEGAIVTFNVAGGSEVEVSNVIATDGSSHRLNGAAVSVGVTTSIDEVASEGETDIFSLDGIRQSVMKAGVNIVRGANGVAKKIFNK